MPAQKRLLPDNHLDYEEEEEEEEEEEPTLQHRVRRKHPRPIPKAVEQLLANTKNDDNDDEDSDAIDPADLPEFVNVDLADVRGVVQCAICLGIIKQTRTVMGCMHRFCRECIDKSMRLGNKECPACRMHCASRRSLRDDPNFDRLITRLYQNIEKYEEEELSLHEEDKTRNKQIQASIAQIFQRQSDALNKRVRTGKDTAADESTPRLPSRNRKAPNPRSVRNNRSTGDQECDGNEEENDEQDEEKDSSTSEDHMVEIKQRKYKRRRGGRRRYQSAASTVVNPDNGCFENEIEARKEIRGNSPGIAWNTERLSWGGGGARSHTRYGSAISSKGIRSARLTKLVEYLQNLRENDNELQVNLMLICLDKERTSPQQLHLCCHSRMSVEQLCTYVANETSLEAKEVEMLLVREITSAKSEQSTVGASTSMEDRSYLSQVAGQAEVGLATLDEQETLAEFQANCMSRNGNLILAYRRKDAK